MLRYYQLSLMYIRRLLGDRLGDTLNNSATNNLPISTHVLWGHCNGYLWLWSWLARSSRQLM